MLNLTESEINKKDLLNIHNKKKICWKNEENYSFANIYWILFISDSPHNNNFIKKQTHANLCI